MRTVVVDQFLDVTEDLGVAPVCRHGHGFEDIAVAAVVGGGRLRVEDEGDGEQAFDPFDQLVSAVCFEGVFHAIASRHFQHRGEQLRVLVGRRIIGSLASLVEWTSVFLCV